MATTNPMGPDSPAYSETYEREERRVMAPRADWNALGSYVAERWRKALARISDRLVLQYFPHGTIAGTGSQGFWSVCYRLPRSKMIYKQSVLCLRGPDGKEMHPDAEILDNIRRAWWEYRHQGAEAVYDRIDQEMANEKAEHEAAQRQDLETKLERDLGGIVKKRLSPNRIFVPA